MLAGAVTIVFANLAVLIAVGVAVGLAKMDKEGDGRHGGLIDFILFGVLQGEVKTHWL